MSAIVDRVRQSKIVGRAALAGPFVVGGLSAAAAFNYLPPLLFEKDVSKYVIAVCLGVIAGLVVEALRRWLSGRAKARLLSSGLDQILDVLLSNAENHAWCHYFEPYGLSQVPSALSTSFALRTLLLTDLNSPDIDVSQSLGRLRTMANPDGGWSAQSQGTDSRPEVIAVVAGTIARFDRSDHALNPARTLLSDVIANDSDPVLIDNTYAVATVLEESAFLGLDPGAQESLLKRLSNGVMTESGLAWWSDKLAQPENAGPSTAATAHAVLAFAAVGRAGALQRHERQTLEAAIRWLQKGQPLDDQTTQLIRHPTVGRQEVNSARHFTAALVSLALSSAGDFSSKAAMTAVETVASRRVEGTWMWRGDRPTWMAYYGTAALVASLLGQDAK